MNSEQTTKTKMMAFDSYWPTTICVCVCVLEACWTHTMLLDTYKNADARAQLCSIPMILFRLLCNDRLAGGIETENRNYLRSPLAPVHTKGD